MFRDWIGFPYSEAKGAAEDRVGWMGNIEYTSASSEAKQLINRMQWKENKRKEKESIPKVIQTETALALAHVPENDCIDDVPGMAATIQISVQTGITSTDFKTLQGLCIQ